MQRINYAAPDMYAVISDIHGNLEALEAVLRDVPEEVETVYCLGDVIGYGANRTSVRNVVCLGDADDLRQPRPRRNRPGDGPELVQSAVLWTRDHLSEENAKFLRTRPRDADRGGSSSTALYAIPTSTSSTRPPRWTTSLC